MNADPRPFYVLRHIPSGKLMPRFEGRAGATYIDPFTSKMPPRLFTTPLAAKNALGWWLKGRVRMNTEQSDAWGPEIVGQTLIENRIAAEWEMIAVHLEHGFPGNDSLKNVMETPPVMPTSGQFEGQERYRK